MAQPFFLTDGTTLRQTDTLWAIENKWLGALLNGGCPGCGGSPSIETFYILEELDPPVNVLLSELSDKLEQELAP